MELNCNFKYDPYVDGRNFYTCFIENQRIPETSNVKHIGKHLPEHSNEQVIDVIFKKCSMTKVPQGLTKVFPNMQDLSIWNSNLKNVTQLDLVEYKNLKRFGFCFNEIEYLPGDLFEDFKNLNEVVFNGTNLKLVEPNILDGLDKLTMVDFTRNSNYSKRYCSIPGHSGNATLQEVKTELYEKFCKNPKNVEKLNCKLKQKIDNLKKINKDLKIENSKRKLEILKLASVVKNLSF